MISKRSKIASSEEEEGDILAKKIKNF